MAWRQLSRSRPGHVPLACTGAKDPLPWSGGHFEPLFSNPTFRLVSENFGFQDLNRPSSRSNIGFVVGRAPNPPKYAVFCGPQHFNGLACTGETSLTLLGAPGATGAALVRWRGGNFQGHDLVTSPWLAPGLRTPCRGRAAILNPCFLIQVFVLFQNIFGIQDLNRSSSRSTTGFVAGRAPNPPK